MFQNLLPSTLDLKGTKTKIQLPVALAVHIQYYASYLIGITVNALTVYATMRVL